MNPPAHPRFVLKLVERALADLPPLPEAVSRVLVESQKSDVSPARLEAIISSDQALAGKVLRVVNSAYYGLAGQVQSLGQACVILGVSQIRNLTLSMAAIGMAESDRPDQREMVYRFWRHSFGTAAAAQTIAQRRNFSPADLELAFLGGLVHDIGRLFLYAHFADVYDRAVEYAAKKQVSLREAEEKTIGMSHAAIGGRMTRLWNLPEPISALIENHEGPFAVAERVTFAVHLGDSVNEYLYWDEPEGVVATTPEPAAVEWLDAPDVEWAEILAVTTAKVEAATESYGAAAA